MLVSQHGHEHTLSDYFVVVLHLQLDCTQKRGTNQSSSSKGHYDEDDEDEEGDEEYQLSDGRENEMGMVLQRCSYVLVRFEFRGPADSDVSERVVCEVPWDSFDGKINQIEK